MNGSLANKKTCGKRLSEAQRKTLPTYKHKIFFNLIAYKRPI